MKEHFVCLKDGVFVSGHRYVKGDIVKKNDDMFANVEKRCMIQEPESKPDRCYSFKRVLEEEPKEEQPKAPAKRGRATKSAK